jgi:lycopene beta-cyclase
MTYFGFLFRFLVIPILILLFITWREKERPTPGFRKSLIWTLASSFMFFWRCSTPLPGTTTWSRPASGITTPSLVTGIVLGYVPIEEYTFFVLETILTGLWWWFLARRIPEPTAPFPRMGEKSAWLL